MLARLILLIISAVLTVTTGTAIAYFLEKHGIKLDSFELYILVSVLFTVWSGVILYTVAQVGKWI